MKQNILKFLPLIIILFSAIGVLSWYAKNKKEEPQIKPEIVSPSDLESEITEITPTPSSFFFFNQPATIPETTEIIPTPTTSEKEDSLQKESSRTTNSTTTITKTQVCTPVYGMADTCEEHIVVDTGAESTLAYSFSALSYLGGLIAFVKSKKD